MMLKLTLAVTLILSAGCVASGKGSCAGWKPILLDAATIDAMTDRDAADVLAHNEFGANICGW